MSGNVNQPPVTPTAPAQAPAPQTEDGAAGIYRRAVQARPTGFAENPIGTMASAVDRIGRAAGNLLAGKELEGRDGLAAAEARLKQANENARANPHSVKARQQQLEVALALFRDMQKLAPNDPRRVKIAQFVVNTANQLGAEGIQLRIPGLDVRGLLRLAAQTLSRYGDAAAMQSAFALEGILASTVPPTSVEALRIRDMLIQRLGLSPQAARLLAAGWGVRLAGAGEVPNMDVSARTLVLDAQQENASLGVLARAYWHDSSLANPADKDGFIQAFLKIANQGGFTVLNRKYRELRRMARLEVATSRATSTGPSGVSRTSDESADMFAALAQYAHSHRGEDLPEAVRPPLERFFA